jgi:hypothetical protein
VQKTLPRPVILKLRSVLFEERQIARKIGYQLKLSLMAAYQGAGMENEGILSYEERLHRPEKANDP